MALPLPSAPSYRTVVISNAVSAAAVLYLGVRYTLLGSEASSAAGAALLAAPSVPAYALFAVMGVAASVAPALAYLRHRLSPDHRAYRIAPIVAVVVGAIHFLVLPSYVPLFPSDTLAAAQVMALADDPPLDEMGFLAIDPSIFGATLEASTPPYLLRGKPQSKWGLLIRTGCTGPITEVPQGAEIGTLLYCVAPSRLEGWFTAVGTGGELVGGPDIVRYKGELAIGHVEPFEHEPSQGPSGGPLPSEAVLGAPSGGESQTQESLESNDRGPPQGGTGTGSSLPIPKEQLNGDATHAP
jgi:hypothetical protein